MTCHQTNQTGELVAVIVALKQIEPFTDVLILSDSRYVIDGITIIWNKPHC